MKEKVYEKSIINYGDSYKYGHAYQYPSNMVKMFDYQESRGGVYPATVFIGLQYYLKKYLTIPIRAEEVERIKLKAERHGVPFDYDGWMHIVNNCNGLMPIKIRAVPEGTLVPTHNVLMTIESTDERVPWGAGFVETLLMKLWYMINIATKSYYVRRMLEKYGAKEWAQFAYHNFGDRGSSSVESAAIGGFAHYATGFMGTDNFDSLDMAEDYYNTIEMPAYSVFATEHSSTTAHGLDNEEQFVYDQLLANPNLPIMSFVADSKNVYEFTHFCTDPDSRIRKLIESRPHQKFVLRPDSGDPIEVLDRMITIMRDNKLVTIPHTYHLFRDFGILWGDGITPDTIEEILLEAKRHKFAAENFVFGSGGDLMQNHTRDTQKFAIKCSSITEIIPPFEYDKKRDSICSMAETIQTDVYKDPITDPGKASKKGEITTYYNKSSGAYEVGPINHDLVGYPDMLIDVFKNGEFIYETDLDAIRTRIANAS